MKDLWKLWEHFVKDFENNLRGDENWNFLILFPKNLKFGAHVLRNNENSVRSKGKNLVYGLLEIWKVCDIIEISGFWQNLVNFF